ncbi:MAG: enoyl-CoA hydratase/isomerase family protein [Desulfarculus sp.]|nr:enoyl-CoA hydratase/isomerase family protein [Pseudomonadota bacterium]MBV1717823.1 enoyl-CoA hydratase/isomerase family protein [Desulfarculus sp.]MBU4573435.1 enoyl-CoA hydratase/isomerase family protein [Pseudomonadota bacterium]MBU4596821.1 enoyl-CoA hydratase/isomerase family protein [Pseudomonadota bacterium]MBV1737298.1 enoyl-CoA hydratase/isomerase family protein [Desulfarculus sp.]
MAYEHIKLAVQDGVATLTLCREPLNVLNIAMMKEINQALDSLAPSGLKVLLIQAEGKAFSAGVDVGEHLGDQVNEMIEVFHGIFRRMEKLGVVSVASVQGAALGGGCELAAYCDLVVASEKAKFGQPEILVGVFPPVAALVFPRQLGYKKALELIVTGDVIGAAEAKAIGLVNQVVPPEELAAATHALVGKLTNLSGLVLSLTKKAVVQGLNDDKERALELIEKVYLGELMPTADAEEGLRAFLDKRKPQWKEK